VDNSRRLKRRAAVHKRQSHRQDCPDEWTHA
jgi:hypothetical protein